MANEKTASPKPRSILDLAPGKLREIDGVVLDLDSYAKHSAPPPVAGPAPSPGYGAEEAGQARLSEPVHTGWYEAKEETVAYPIMERYVYVGGSGSGSYVSSYRTSYTRTSGSGSWTTSGSGVFSVGGYGLELI
ncbi:hypothetical protein LI291_00820 [Intestinibacillus massiliensis]|nr:hypothetical protein [Intestinibacillus massiliensis]